MGALLTFVVLCSVIVRDIGGERAALAPWSAHLQQPVRSKSASGSSVIAGCALRDNAPRFVKLFWEAEKVASLAATWYQYTLSTARGKKCK
jgi:hypothetical protein